MHEMHKLALCGGKPVRKRPFPSLPASGKKEIAAIGAVLRKGQWSGHVATAAHARLEDGLAQFHDVRFGVLTPSGTASLEVAMEACGVEPGDEVIVSPYTCIADAEAILRVGAIPVFGDIDPNTYGLDLSKLDGLITRKTTCIIDIYFGGYLGDVEAMRRFARKRGLVLIEDAVLAHGAAWRGKKIGAFGQAACLSLGFGKLVTVGEGGIVLTDDPEIARRCRMVRHNGREFRDRHGKPIDYEWATTHGETVDGPVTVSLEQLGWNYRMPEVLAALGWAQFQRYPAQLKRRDANGRYLERLLADIPGVHPLPCDPRQTVHPYSIFLFKLEGRLQKARHRFIEALNAELTGGIMAGYGNPLYHGKCFHGRRLRKSSPSYRHHFRKIDYTKVRCDQAEKACADTVWVWHNAMAGTQADMRDIAAAVDKVAANVAVLETLPREEVRPSGFGW